MPQPLSDTRITSLPPFSSVTSIRVAPASTEFSSNSFSTLAGRSITSPAAILFTTLGDSCRIVGIENHPDSTANLPEALLRQTVFFNFAVQRPLTNPQH